MLLLQPPFFRLDAPSLGLASLEAALLGAGARCDLEHLNLRYGARVGAELYGWVAGRAPRQLLLGDLLFAPSLHGRPFDLDRVSALAARLAPRRDEPVPAALLDELPALEEAARAFLDETAQRFRFGDYDLVGIGTFFNVIPALALAKLVKRLAPTTTVILGGCNCEGDLGLALHERFPFVDLVCRGEGEELVVELALRQRRRASLDGIPGLVFRDERGGTRCNAAPDLSTEERYPLDRLATPRYDRWLAEARGLGLVAPEELQLPFETSRGCFFGQRRHCLFCGLNGERIRFRRKSPARVLEEVRALASQGVRALHATDNVLDRALLRSVFPELAREGRTCRIFWEVRPEFTRGELELLASSGVVWLQAGIESLSTAVLRRMGKGTTALGNIRFLRLAAELGIAASWSLLFGIPGEDPAEYDAIAALVPAITHLQPPRLVQEVRVDRFSPLFVEREGLAEVRPAAAYSEIFPFDPAEVARLAYFFEHEHDPPRDSHAYVARCTQALDRWREELGRAALIRFDTGASLHIVDTRATAVRRATVLRGLTREIYLAAEEGASPGAITERTGASAGAVSELAGTLLEERHAVLLDGNLLALAVPVDGWVPPGVPAVLVVDALVDRYRERLASLYRGYQPRDAGGP